MNTNLPTKARLITGTAIVMLLQSGMVFADHKGVPHGGGSGTEGLGKLDCIAGEIAKFDGSDWVCAVDEDTTDTDWNNLTNVPADIADGDDDTDTNAATLCSGAEVLLGDASCVALEDVVDDLFRERTIFVTSVGYTGNLGGLPGADAICQSHADSANAIVPVGTYIALLSTDWVNASERPTLSIGPVIRPDGAPVAQNIVSLFTANDFVTLANPVDIDETGAQIISIAEAHTGSTSGGILAPDDVFFGLSHCQNWTSASLEDTELWRAFPSETTGDWFGKQAFPEFSECAISRHLYCLEQ